MTDGPQQPPDSDGNAPQGSPESHPVSYSQVSALVPEHVRGGVFSTGAVVLQGAHEFILDFLQRMTRPYQVVARVVLPPAVTERFIAALQENLQNYERTFGVVPRAPQPQSRSGVAADAPHEPGLGSTAPQTVPNQSSVAQDLYDQLKLPDEILAGTYANAVMIGHTATEFSFDFISSFFPRSVVSCRVYLAAPNAERLLVSLKQSFEQYRRQLKSQQGNPPRGSE